MDLVMALAWNALRRFRCLVGAFSDLVRRTHRFWEDGSPVNDLMKAHLSNG